MTEAAVTTAQPNQALSAQPAGGTPAPAPASNFTVPEAYAASPWVEKIKSSEDLWKTTANLQEMIGKRPAGIPSNDASDADWDNFYKAAGRPDEAKYEFKDPEGLPEGFDSSPYKEQISNILHAAGLNQRQAGKIYDMYMKVELESHAKSQEESAAKEKALDEEFAGLVKEHFGDDFDAASKLTSESFKRYAPQSLKEAILDIADKPKALAAVTATIKGMQSEIDRVKKEYGAEGTLSSGSPTNSASIEDTRSELATLRTSQAARDFTHVDNKKTMERINELSSIVSRHYKT